MARSAVALAALLSAAEAVKIDTIQQDQDSEALSKNPIRKVVTLLQNLAKKVAAEGEEEKELFEKFQCYCKTGASDLQASISGNNAKVPQVQSDIEEAESSVAQLKLDLKQHQADRAAAKQAMDEATAIREKDHAKFAEESAEVKAYVDALAKAVPAIMNGMAGMRGKEGAVQLQLGSGTAAILRKAAASDLSLTEDDRETVVSFIGSGTASKYIPGSTEILGILKTMQEDFEGNYAEMVAEEEEAVKLYDNLIAAKTKEVNTLGAAIEKKTVRVGDLGVEIVRMKQDLTESEKMLIEDQKFLADLDKNCEGKQAEFDERVKVRAEELTAIHETIAILNDDDALDLFKKTLPSSSFLQVDAQLQATKARALKALNPRKTLDADTRPEIKFLAMAIQGKKVDFSKVIKMIDDMIMLLAQEQVDDDAKKEYCTMQIDQVEDKAKELRKSKSDTETSIEDSTESIGTITEELKTLNAEIKELDKLVMEASEQRKKENEEFQQVMSENSAAKELLEYAKNRLNKFYNPKLAKPEPKQELSEDEQIAVNMGGTAPPTPAPGGIAGTGVEAPALVQQHVTGDAKPEPAPVTWEGDYKKKGEETTGVVSMIDLLIRDLTKEMTVAETEEENAQKEYENFMDDSAGKRAKAVKAVGIKQAAKADTEQMKIVEEGNLKETTAQLQATIMYEQQLHAECDWMMQNYDLRKTARAEESDNLKTAKAVLKGADFGGASLVQVRHAKFLGSN